MLDLRKEPEILDYDRDKEQILDANNYVENAHRAVGFASGLFSGSNGVFNTSEGLRIANELCAYMRLLKEGKAK